MSMMRTLLRFSHARDSRLKPRLGLCRESSPPVPLSLRERGNYLPCPLSGTERGSGGEDRQVPSREFTRAHWVRSLPIVLLSALACAHPTGSGTPTPAAGPYDVVIEGGRVVDGTGNPWFYGDVAITGDRIARITPPGLLRQASARRRIDAHGLVVAPGIIDIQAQSGSELLRGDSRVISMVTQGVTTMIMGEGETRAPANAQVMARYRGDSAEERLCRGFGARGARRDLSSQGGGREELAQGAAGGREDRLGAGGGAGRGGRSVRLHGGGERPVVVHSPRCARRRQAARAPGGRAHARRDQRGHAAPRRGVGQPVPRRHD